MTEYNQQFIRLTSLKKYPEVHEILKSVFPAAGTTLHNNLYTIVCSLLANKSVAVSRDYAWYKRHPREDWYTRWYAVKAQDMLAEKGLVTIQKGRRAREGYETGFSSVISSTKTLDKLLNGLVLRAVTHEANDNDVLTLNRNGIGLDSLIHLDPSVLSPNLSKELLVDSYLQTASLNEKYFGRMRLGFAPYSGLTTCEGLLFEKAREMSENGNKQSISMAVNILLTRMFTSQGCGRFYQRSQSYQNIGCEARKCLTINGAVTREVDYAGIHVNLAYLISGHHNPYVEDPYRAIADTLGFPDNSDVRTSVKRYFIILLNTHDYQTAAKAFVYNHLKYYRELKKRGIKLNDVNQAILKAHPNIALSFMPRQHKADLLMLHESNIMARILSELEKRHINGLPLHDGIICEQHHSKTIPDIMKTVYKEYTDGHEIAVKTV